MHKYITLKILPSVLLALRNCQGEQIFGLTNALRFYYYKMFYILLVFSIFFVHKTVVKVSVNSFNCCLLYWLNMRVNSLLIITEY